MTFEIKQNDVILPLFTKELREHLLTSLNNERELAKQKMKKDGWGVTVFGEPNKFYYGDYTSYFYNYYRVGFPIDALLTVDLKPVKEGLIDGRLFMKASKVIDGCFELLPLNADLMHSNCHKFFKGFKFNVKDYGKDFYKMGCNFTSEESTTVSSKVEIGYFFSDEHGNGVTVVFIWGDWCLVVDDSKDTPYLLELEYIQNIKDESDKYNKE